MVVYIREAGQEDIGLIQELARRSWAAAYKTILSAAQMEYMLMQMYSVAVLARQLDAGHQFLLMQAGSSTVGFAGFEYNSIEEGVTKLHKLYLVPETQGKGYGKLLIAEVEARATLAGQKEIALNVNRQNKALQFYLHLAYTISGEADIDIGQGFFMNDYELRKKV